MTDYEKYCLSKARYDLECDKRCDRTATTLPINVLETLLRMAEDKQNKNKR